MERSHLRAPSQELDCFTISLKDILGHLGQMQFVTLEFLWEVEVVRLVQLGYFQFSRHPPPTKWPSRSYLDKMQKKGQVDKCKKRPSGGR